MRYLFGVLLLAQCFLGVPEYSAAEDSRSRDEVAIESISYIGTGTGEVGIRINGENGWGFCMLLSDVGEIIFDAAKNSFVVDDEGITLKFRSPAEFKRLFNDNLALASRGDPM